jgi:hypothetical protein
MDFLISESQLKVILQEQDESKMSTYMKTLYSFTYSLVNKVIKKYGINVKMLLTWGTSVGGLVLPLDNFIREGNFKLDDNQRLLIIAGIAAILYYENKSLFSKILKKIKEEGLEDIFNIVLEKGQQLKSVFFDFLQSVNVSVGSFMDTVAYSFLIPIIADIHSISIRTKTVNEAALLIAERLVASGVVILSAEVISKSLKKIIKRFK